MIHIVGAPFDLCGRRLGSRLGPIAVRMEGLVAGLERLGHTVKDTGAVVDLDASTAKTTKQKHDRANAVYSTIRDRVAAAAKAKATPIVLGGDHSVAIGSIAGALRAHGEKLAVLWIDAHVDINTPEVSPSGNLHGMPLAALTGLKSKATGEMKREWDVLGKDVIGKTKLDAKKLAWLGLRDVDKGEIANLNHVPGAQPLTMQDVDELGVKGALTKILKHFEKNGAKALWVSFDVDCLDPVFAPGTGTAVRGGFTYREGHLIAETLHAYFRTGKMKLAGLDIVEVNPLADTNNETANVAMEWALSFFGKTILHPEDPGRTER
jgi:arginase